MCNQARERTKGGPRAESSWRRHSLARPQPLIGLVAMASLEDLAFDLASSYAHRRETLLRQQDAAVRAAEEKARRSARAPRRNQRILLLRQTGAIEAHRPKYQIEVPPASRWRPLAAFGSDDEHEQPTLVATDGIAAAPGRPRRSARPLRARSATAGGRRRRRSLSTTASSPPPSSSRLKPMATARPLHRHHRAPSRLLLLLLLRRRHRP